MMALKLIKLKPEKDNIYLKFYQILRLLLFNKKKWGVFTFGLSIQVFCSLLQKEMTLLTADSNMWDILKIYSTALVLLP